MERRANEEGRFILCSILDLEAKRFCLVFPERKGILGGWVTLAKKLRSLGVAAPLEGKAGSVSEGDKASKSGRGQVEDEKRAFVVVAKATVGRLGDVIWLQLGGRELRSRKKQLGHCLVGWWGECQIRFQNWLH